MAEGIPARLSVSEGRRFGFTVGGAFLVLAALALWRGRGTLAVVFGLLGALLVVGGAMVPPLLGPVQAAWMRAAHAISRVTTPIVMGVAYFLVLSSIGLVRRLFGRNRLVRRKEQASFWVAVKAEESSDMHRQF